MKHCHTLPLLGAALVMMHASLASEAPCDTPSETNIASNWEQFLQDYGPLPDGSPRFVPIRGMMCAALWECDGLLRCQTGDSGSKTEDGKLYFSPLIWAMLDLEQCTDPKLTPGDLKSPRIEGNTPGQARQLVLQLIDENRHDCVNDKLLGHETFTPLILAGDDTELVHRLLKKGADPNVTFRNRSLLSMAVGKRNGDLVRLLLSYGADPSPEANPDLAPKLTFCYVSHCPQEEGACLAMILAAQKEGEKRGEP